MSSSIKRFAHIYVEKDILDHPRVEQWRQRYPNAQWIVVDDYKSVFSRPRQNFDLQKRSPKWILARKKDQFVYSGNQYVQDFCYENFAYNALVLNCPYDCRYCYLQGMYGSANTVVFVNLEDYFEATDTALHQRKNPTKPLHLAISYDTDLLALENALGYVSAWADFARNRPELLLEVRTKSANIDSFRDRTPQANLVFAWTLSPQAVVEAYEKQTPSLERRLAAMAEMATRGWPVRLCLDPVLRVPDWQQHYHELVQRIFEVVPAAAISEVSLGVFRMSSDYFKRMRKQGRTDLLHYPFEHANNTVSYFKEEREEMLRFLQNELTQHISINQLHIWT
jgi:spore photoproduct lyase